VNLDEYVKKTLLDITNGIAAAADTSRCWIGPVFAENSQHMLPQIVKFEIAVTVSKEAGGGIKVWSFGDAKASVNSEQINKIAFEVPVYFSVSGKPSSLRSLEPTATLDRSEAP
jgi:hypothetical protein